MRNRPRINIDDLTHMLWMPIGMAALMVAVTLTLGEPIFIFAYGLLAVAAFGMRWLLAKLPGADDHHYSNGETMATAALAWVMIALLAAIPFWCAPWLASAAHDVAVFRSPLNGLFEAVSGITSTGLSMVPKPSELPANLQFWRTLTEWIGGVGIALLMITLLNPASDSDDLFGAELNKKFKTSANATGLWIWKIYLALSAFAVGLFWLLGMPWWESLNHGLTGVATGGFSVTDGSFGDYARPLQLAAMLIMASGAISFAAYRTAIQRRNPLVMFRRGPVALFFIGVMIATILLWASRLAFDTDGGLYIALFQTVSAFATAGFSTVDLSNWHSSPLAILVLCMLIGGASGATTGGIKTDRVLLLCRGVGWRFQRLFGMRKKTPVEIDGQFYSNDTARLQVEGAATLAAVWMLSIMVGCLLLASVVGDDWNFTQVGFEVVSALGSVGLTTGITSAELHPAGKWTLITLMWAGRLELMAALALLWLPLAGRNARR